MDEQYEYDVALSFAGTDREIAREFAEIAEANQLRVFIDEEHLWESWGKNLSEYLQDIYSNKSRFCVIFISKDYCEKAYTNAERRYALDRVLQSKTEYILPIKIDDSWADGLALATAYLDLREIPISKAATLLVKKIKGEDSKVIMSPMVMVSKVVEISTADTQPFPVQPDVLKNTGVLSFASLQLLKECKGWRESTASDCHTDLCWRTGDYDDPMFDITIINKTNKPVLLTAVGIQVTRMHCDGMKIMGGDWAQTVNLHRTYKIALPDLWNTLALKQRELALKYNQDIDIAAVAKCRLPDPIFIKPYRPYRFGLHLFDYVSFCPNYMELYFWAMTDAGECLSEKVTLTYLIGRNIPPISRYFRILDGNEEVKRQEDRALGYLWPAGEKQRRLEALAYSLWEKAGKPEGKEKDLWYQAERTLSSQILTEEDLHFLHRRPLE